MESCCTEENGVKRKTASGAAKRVAFAPRRARKPV
jgi:hypothetical protein